MNTTETTKIDLLNTSYGFSQMTLTQLLFFQIPLCAYFYKPT